MTMISLLWTICLLVILPTTYSDCNNEGLGKEYLMVFMDMDSPVSKEEVLLSPPEGGTIRVVVPSYPTEVDRSHTLGTKEQKSDVHDGVRLNGTEKAHKVFKLSSADVFAAFGMNGGTAGCEGYWALPTDRLGREYYLINHYPPSVAGEMAVAAGSQGARVAVYPVAGRSTSLDFYSDSVPPKGRLMVDLGPHEAFQIRSPDQLSGTRIYSNKPVAVFSGNVQVTVNNAGATGLHSHLVEQLVPASQWGTVFYVAPFPDRQYTIIWMVGSVLGANVSVYGVQGLGRVLVELTTDNPKHIFLAPRGYYTIKSSNPIQVVQVADSEVLAESTHSPLSAMAIVPSSSQFKKEYYFTLPEGAPGKPFQHIVLLVIEKSKRNELRLDGTVVDQSDWVDLPLDNNMSGKTLSLTDGSHWLRHPDTPFSAVLYGSDEDTCTYAMPAGLCIKQNPDAELSTDFPGAAESTTETTQPTTTTTTTKAGISTVSKDPAGGSGDTPTTTKATSKASNVNVVRRDGHSLRILALLVLSVYSFL